MDRRAVGGYAQKPSEAFPPPIKPNIEESRVLRETEGARYRGWQVIFDGGSYAAEFQNQAGSQFWVIFLIPCIGRQI